MHVDLLEFLSCVRPHEPSWLVASVDLIEERDIVSGRLGCPTCGTEYLIGDGVADFRIDAAHRMGSGPPGFHDATNANPQGNSDLALRAAALLDLTTPGGFVLLAGSWSVAGFELVALLDGVHALVLNPATHVASGYGVSVVLSSNGVPVREGTSRGAALDAMHSTPEWIARTAAAVRAHGRIVAPADAQIPPELSLLARDSRNWVAETTRATASIVQIARGRPANA
ncbi:MAG: Trm112 family protein [Anaerolineae bacterium]|nr:Trm112 family protein [Gemmatimonadaceae bacterium]